MQLPPAPTLVISRTDNLGDVILTLPLAGIIKGKVPDARIVFLGKRYTEPILRASEHIDVFLDIDEVLRNPSQLSELNPHAMLHVFPNRHLARLAKQLDIPLRIGTSHRMFHWLTCNRLLHFGRKNSALHEAQLNCKLLAPLGLPTAYTLNELGSLYGLTRTEPLAPEIGSLLSQEKINLILHPKSKGSARDWPLANYLQLLDLLSTDRYKVFVTGTEAEGQIMQQQCPELLAAPQVSDLTGKLSLAQLLSFIQAVDGLVACSTGPLHMAAALGKHALGLYPPIRPMHPGRWAPLGQKAEVMVLVKTCSDCRKSGGCTCIAALAPYEVAHRIARWHK